MRWLMLYLVFAGLACSPTATTTQTVPESSPAASASTSPSVSATPATTTTPAPVLSKPTPCPAVPQDAAKTGVEGQVIWDGVPVAGVLVGVRQPGAPHSGPIEASATSDAAGRYRISGVTIGRPFFVSAPAQGAFIETNGAGFTVCADEMASVSPLALRRAITGLDLPLGTVLPTSTLRLQWDAVPHATTYCVGVWTGDGAQPGPGVCSPLPGALPTTSTSFAVTGLRSGRVFFVDILALDNAVAIGALPQLPVLTFAVAPLGAVLPCAAPAESPSSIVGWFFRLLEESRVLEMATCWGDAVPNRLELMRGYAGTGGTKLLLIGTETPTASGAVAVEVRLVWQNTDQFGAWASGQTKWLILRRQPDGRWAIESVATALAPAAQ